MMRSKNFIYISLSICIFLISSCSNIGTETCDICGYIAVSDGKCQYCGHSAWNDNMEIEKEDYLRVKQLEWFYVPGMEVSFYEPKKVTDFLEEKTYLKDSTWKPTISESDIKTYQKNLQ